MQIYKVQLKDIFLIHLVRNAPKCPPSPFFVLTLDKPLTRQEYLCHLCSYIVTVRGICFPEVGSILYNETRPISPYVSVTIQFPDKCLYTRILNLAWLPLIVNTCIKFPFQWLLSSRMVPVKRTFKFPFKIETAVSFIHTFIHVHTYIHACIHAFIYTFRHSTKRIETFCSEGQISRMILKQLLCYQFHFPRYCLWLVELQLWSLFIKVLLPSGIRRNWIHTSKLS